MKAEELRPDQILTVAEFLTLSPRDMDGYFAERALDYTRIKAPKDAWGENGGNDILIPPGGLGDGQLPPGGRIHFAYMTDSLVQDPWNGETLRNLMRGRGFRYSYESCKDVTVTFTHRTDGRHGSYHMGDYRKERVCAMVAACKAFGILKDEAEAV